jgi:predicted Zn-dependent protease with MMP-like domain
MSGEDHSISPEAFAELVREALAQLPAPYAKLIEEISVVVEEEPPPEVLEEIEMEEEEEDLLGLYQGVSLADQSFFHAGGQQPARIAIYRGPILRLCRLPEEVRREVRDTVVHELGHHVGLDDDEMPY